MNLLQFLYLRSYRRAKGSCRELDVVFGSDFQHIEVKDFSSDLNGFNDWVALNGWETRFPVYAQQWLPPHQPAGTIHRKLAEHYVSTELGNLLGLTRDAVIVDVAAAGSPFQAVLSEIGYTNVWRSDLNYSTDLQKRVIGGSGSVGFDVFGESVVDLMVSHNSIEHFERGEDLALFRQIDRILRPGGRFVWVPLGLTRGGLSETDPSVWESKYRNAKGWPRFERRYPVVVSNRKQRLMKWWDPSHLDSTVREAAPNCRATIYNLKHSAGGKMAFVLEKHLG